MPEIYEGPEDCCSCHINPPCGYCTREWDCECDGDHVDGHAPGCAELETD